ncbi:MAG: cytidine deaminase [candidate division WS1 bacterium]|jgi:cytidine deaminase|nr:cytidine deaminase [candidate division WS1 bacterium]
MAEAATVEELVAAARDARVRARATYSNFPVGAAVRCADGRIFQGCNIENASLGLTMCAERVALFSAVAAGCHHITAIAIAGPGSDPLSPCGACRQVMLELAPDADVILAGDEEHRVYTVADLLPDAFGVADLGDSAE